MTCSFIMNTTRDCTCNRLFFVITMLHNLNMHIEIYLCSWSFDTAFFRDGIHFIYRIYEHASCFAYYLIPTFRLVYIGVIFFSHELIITGIFIYAVIDFSSGSVAHGQWKLIRTSDFCQIFSGSFQQSLVEIGSIVSEKIFF